MTRVCHPCHEATTYVNSTNKVDKLNTSFTQNILIKLFLDC